MQGKLLPEILSKANELCSFENESGSALHIVEYFDFVGQDAPLVQESLSHNGIWK
jgi:hypothetical protein